MIDGWLLTSKFALHLYTIIIPVEHPQGSKNKSISIK